MTMPTWAEIPQPLRVLARWITIAQAAGYGVGLAFARQNVARFDSTDGALAANEMLLSAHSHLLGMTALFGMSSLCFAFCSNPTGRLKTLIIAAPFAAILLAFTAIWLMKYGSGFVWILAGSFGVMTLVFYTQIIVTLRELRKARAGSAP